MAKTCNFGNYLDTTICDQSACGHRDKKCQQELLGIQEVTADIGLQKVAAADVASKETEGIREVTSGASFSMQLQECSVICAKKYAICLKHIKQRKDKPDKF